MKRLTECICLCCSNFRRLGNHFDLHFPGSGVLSRGSSGSGSILSVSGWHLPTCFAVNREPRCPGPIRNSTLSPALRCCPKSTRPSSKLMGKSSACPSLAIKTSVQWKKRASGSAMVLHTCEVSVCCLCLACGCQTPHSGLRQPASQLAQRQTA